MQLTGDANTPALPMTEAEVNHMRRLLAWLRCEYTLDADMQRGYLSGVSECVRLEITSEEQASALVHEKAEQINRCPAYVRQAVKMLTKALRAHELAAGIVEDDPLHALAVLGEEFGELTKDVLQMTYEPGKTNAENVRKEAIQTAAMALRFVASLDAYIYKAGEQHRQEQWKAAQDAYAASGGLHPCYD